MQASRALLGVGSAMFVLYALLFGVYFTREGRKSADMATAGSETQYVVTTTDGEQHLLKDAPGDPGAVLIEAGRRFGEVTAVRKLEPGDPLPESGTNWNGRLRMIALLLLTFPLAMVALGFRARARADRVRALWNAVSPTLTVPAGPLKARLGLDDAGLHQLVERLNSEGRVQLIFDVAHKRVYDRRLSDHTISVQFCPRCNEPLSLRLIADLLQTPKCPRCMFVIEQGELDHLKADIVQQLRNDAGADAEGDFSMGTFLALALLFPPGAIYYGMNHS